jgi:hypothetical protein
MMMAYLQASTTMSSSSVGHTREQLNSTCANNYSV